jgi:hypothetical protein
VGISRSTGGGNYQGQVVGISRSSSGDIKAKWWGYQGQGEGLRGQGKKKWWGVRALSNSLYCARVPSVENEAQGSFLWDECANALIKRVFYVIFSNLHPCFNFQILGNFVLHNW